MSKKDLSLKINDQYPEELSSILKLHSFTVPLYQRDYTWQSENWDELFHDIKQESSVFLGTIFLFKKKTNDSEIQSEIIDGQQRITTFSLLINAFRLTYLKKVKKANVSKILNDLNKFLFTTNNAPKLLLYQDPQGIVNTNKTYLEVLNYQVMPLTLKKIDLKIQALNTEKKDLTKKLKELNLRIEKLNQRKKKTTTEANSLSELKDSKLKLNNTKKEITESIKKFKEKKGNLKLALESKSESEKNILDCNEFFYDRLNELDEKDQKVILKKIKDEVKVFLMLTSDTNSVYDYFRTLNSSGVDLTISEILKNDLFKNVLKKDVDEVVTAFEELKKSITNVKKNDIEGFLLYSLNSRHDAKLIAKTIKKDYPISKKNMLHAYGAILKKDGKKDGAKKLVESLKENIEEYLQIISPKSIDNYMKFDKFYYYNALDAFNISKPISVFLTSKRNYTKENHLKNVMLLTYICLKQSIKPYGDPKDLQNYMNTAYDEFLKKSSYSKIKEVLSQKTKRFFDEEFIDKELVLAKKPLSNAKSKALIALLYRNEWKLMHGTYNDYSSLSLEHIMPENQSEPWRKVNLYKGEPKAKDSNGKDIVLTDNTVYKKWVGQIGNHCIISLIDNKEIKDKGFSEKLKKYKTYKSSLMQGIIDKRFWTLSNIKQRNKVMYTRFLKLIN
jgi:uncharacterized protein with ParB-like and HNH nuclease domain